MRRLKKDEARPLTSLKCAPRSLVNEWRMANGECSLKQQSQRDKSMPASNKIALFIDDANIYATIRTLGFDIDYKRLLKEFQSRGSLLQRRPGAHVIITRRA